MTREKARQTFFGKLSNCGYQTPGHACIPLFTLILLGAKPRKKKRLKSHTTQDKLFMNIVDLGQTL